MNCEVYIGIYIILADEADCACTLSPVLCGGDLEFFVGVRKQLDCLDIR